jgi:TonB-dependent receptor
MKREESTVSPPRVWFHYLFIILLTVICFNSSVTLAQTNGKIVGVVADSTNGSLFPGANVALIGTVLGASTDVNGGYRIFNVPAGSYQVRATYVGYQSKVLYCQLGDGQTQVINFSLSPTIIEGKEIVVTAQREGQLAAINQQLQSDQLVNMVSSERMREVPDANAAESIGRLPGISLKRSSGEGQGIVIRGLSPKYNTVTLNGVKFASSNNTDRGIDLSFVTTESLEGIEVYKAITADMEADNIGGTVNFTMTKAKSESEYAIRLYGAYNQMEDDLSQFRSFALLKTRVFEDLMGIQASVNAERRNRGRDLMKADFYQKDLPKNPDGSDAGVYYEIRQASIDDQQETRSRYGGSLVLDGGSLEHQFIFSNLFSYSQQDILLRQHKFASGDGVGTIQVEEIDRNSYSLINSLQGEHELGQFQIDWNAGHSVSKGQTPFDQFVVFREGNVGIPDIRLDPEDFLSAMAIDSTATFYQSEYHTGLSEERQLSAMLNVTYHFNLGQTISGFVKSGGKLRHVNRSNDENNVHSIASYLDKKVYIEDWLDPDYDPGKVLNGRTELGLILDPARNRPFFDDFSSRLSYFNADNDFIGDNNDYEATENIRAGYLMAQFRYADLLTLTPGIRYESEDNNYVGYYRIIKSNPPYPDGDYYPQTAERNNGFWFPMVHLKFTPFSSFDVRLAYTKTISRPNYLWLIPSESRRALSLYVNLGNPSLRPTLSNNYDMKMSLYGRYGLVSLGFFYKDIKDFSYLFTLNPTTPEEAIANGIPPTKDFLYHWVTTSVNTQQNSTVKGIEIDIQPNLSLLPGFLSGFVVYANVALIRSDSWLNKKVVIGYDPVTWQPIYDIGFRKGPLPNQADYVANLSIGYDIGGLSARFSMYLQGKSLDEVGNIESEDSYVDPISRLDFTLKMEITKNLSLYLNGVNMINAPDVQRQASTSKYRSVEYFGAMYDVGIGYEF